MRGDAAMRADCGRATATTLSVRLNGSTVVPGLAEAGLADLSPPAAAVGSEAAKPKRSALVAHAGWTDTAGERCVRVTSGWKEPGPPGQLAGMCMPRRWA